MKIYVDFIEIILVKIRVRQ